MNLCRMIYCGESHTVLFCGEPPTEVPRIFFVPLCTSCTTLHISCLSTVRCIENHSYCFLLIISPSRSRVVMVKPLFVFWSISHDCVVPRSTVRFRGLYDQINRGTMSTRFDKRGVET